MAVGAMSPITTTNPFKSNGNTKDTLSQGLDARPPGPHPSYRTRWGRIPCHARRKEAGHIPYHRRLGHILQSASLTPILTMWIPLVAVQVCEFFSRLAQGDPRLLSQSHQVQSQVDREIDAIILSWES